MSSAYVIQKSTNNQFFFNLTANNNEKILTSETYKDKESAKEGIQSVRVNSPIDERYSRKTSVDNKCYFTLSAVNKEIIGKSETYSSPQAMENGIASVKLNGPIAPVIDKSQ
jgi:uncharacterized protein